MLFLMLWGIVPHASPLMADTQKTDQPVQKNLSPQTDKEIDEMLELIEILQDMEMFQDYDIFAEEKSDEKKN